MPRASTQRLSGVARTLLIPLYFRAAENARTDALLRDERAAELVGRIDYDSSRLSRETFEQLTTIMRARQFDRWARAFLAEHPGAAVVEIGCGLDTRFWRLDDGLVQWYDLDLPEVIALRRELVAETPRCQMIACSALDLAWMDALGKHRDEACLFLAESVLPYFEPADARRLVLELRARFPGSELIIDAVPPWEVGLSRFQRVLQGTGARVRWGLRRGQEVESWAPGIRLLDEWCYFDRPEPRLGLYRLLRYFPPVGRGFRVERYRLGEMGHGG